MKYIFILLIKIYQLTISPIFHIVFGTTCRYPVSCSEYAKQSLQKYGLIKGLRLGLVRFLSCQPFGTIHTT